MAQIYSGKWKVLGSLNEGGQAHTFLVYDVNDPAEKRYVLKRLKSPNRIDRFKKEIEACLSLEHNNILKIEDKDLESERPYFVSEYCSRGALNWSSISELSLLEKLHIFSAICQGVSYAHGQKNNSQRFETGQYIPSRGSDTCDWGLRFMFCR